MFLVGVIPAVDLRRARAAHPRVAALPRGEGPARRRPAQVARDSVGGTTARAVDAKIDEIGESLRREDKPSLRDLRGPAFGLQPIVWVGILLSVFQQFVGINVIFYYSTTLWQAVGFSESDSFLVSVITSV